MSRVSTIDGQRMVFTTCVTCGVQYCVAERLWDEQRSKGGYHYCFNGHEQGWGKGQTEMDALKRERDRLKQRVAQEQDATESERQRRLAAQRSARAHKGQATKLRRRAKAGVCPCCNRTFQNLARHMGSKHPNFPPEAEEPLRVIEGGKFV